MAYGINLEHKICVVCNEKLITSNKRKKCHDECREQYYRDYQLKRYHEKYGHKRYFSALIRSRASWNILNHSCIVEHCGYNKITRKIKIAKKEDGKETVEEVSMCPMHLYEYKLGYLKAWTWETIDIANDGKP